MNDSNDGSGIWALGRYWTPLCPPDTTPEAAAAQQRAWARYTGEERLTIWLKRIWMMNEFRLQRLREMNPDKDEPFVRRLWLEQTYPGEFSEGRLEAFEASYRQMLEGAGSGERSLERAGRSRARRSKGRGNPNAAADVS